MGLVCVCVHVCVSVGVGEVRRSGTMRERREKEETRVEKMRWKRKMMKFGITIAG